jgi:hypothetical protein
MQGECELHPDLGYKFFSLHFTVDDLKAYLYVFMEEIGRH